MKSLQGSLVGMLSKPMPALLQQTKSAETHNIASEETLGLTDYQFHRAPNATVGFVDGKVNVKRNKTIAWLSKMSYKEQNILMP